MVICLERRAGAIATHYLASVKSRLVLTFWYRLTQVVLDKGPLNRCVFCHYGLYRVVPGLINRLS